MGIREVLIAPRAPWQNPFVERVIGSIRRECLDHFLILNERPSPPAPARLRRLLQPCFMVPHLAMCLRT